MGETGTLGMVLYAWLYIALMVVGVRVARHGRSALTRAVSAGYVGVSVAVGVNAFLATVLGDSHVGALSVGMGGVYGNARQSREDFGDARPPLA